MPRPQIKSQKQNKSNRYYLLRYGSLAFQLLFLLLVVIFLGIQLDKKTGLSYSLFSWLFPIIVVVVMIVKVLKDTANKK
jgi:uncharacterized integral membrane protein